MKMIIYLVVVSINNIFVNITFFFFFLFVFYIKKHWILMIYKGFLELRLEKEKLD